LEHTWYKTVRGIVKIGLFFTHKKIIIYGKENIPPKGPIIFIGNHQNALIDAILIPTTTSRNIHFLTRASAFKSKITAKILRSLNMIPVYRIRDGINSVEKNIEIFEQCFEILKKEKAIQIFAEGEHHLKRRVIPLKKGFARIILGTLQKYPDLNIKIVPVGINYDSHLNYPFSASVYYGNPIEANAFFNVENPDLTFKHILREVHTAMKTLTTHIDKIEEYDETIVKLNALNVDYLNPIETNKILEKIDSHSQNTTPQKKNINWLAPIHLLTKINSVFPLLIWKYLKSKINDIVFMNTYRFALILTIFPLFYLIQAGIISYFFNYKIGLMYLGICILTGIISTKTMTVIQ
jgi:1-acyl-sn-glycerol-3-phosphate acyltransferase